MEQEGGAAKERTLGGYAVGRVCTATETDSEGGTGMHFRLGGLNLSTATGSERAVRGHLLGTVTTGLAGGC